MGYTLTEKILLAHAEVDQVAPGDVVMTNDISGPMAFHTMQRIGVPLDDVLGRHVDHVYVGGAREHASAEAR